MRPPEPNFKGVDWTKTSSVIAKELGCSYHMVTAKRKTSKRFQKSPHRRRDYSKVNWNMNNVDISKKMGVTPAAVAHVRRRLNAPKSPGVRGGKKAREKDKFWKAVDWSLPNREIARILGVSVPGVFDRRIKLGKPKVYEKERLDFSKVNWNLNDYQIADLLGCDHSRVSRVRRELKAPKSPGKGFKTKNIPWHWWKETNVVLAERLGVSRTRMAILRRRQAPARYGKMTKGRGGRVVSVERVEPPQT